jgi:hypothetical protein
MITSLTQLSATSAALAERLLDYAVAPVAPKLRTEIRDAMLAHLCELLDPEATTDEVADAMAALGPVDFGEPGIDGFFTRLLAGARLRGLDERIATTWWAPADARLFLPRAFGWGWDLNFGAVAVRLGLIEPDAEAVPFTATPELAFKVAAVVPAAMAAATVLHYVARGRSLPAQLPSHWGVDGAPDRWTPKPAAAVTDLMVTGLAAGVGVWAATSSRPGPERAGALAGATMAGVLGGSTTLLRGLRRPHFWASPAMVVSSFAAVGAVLYGLAKAGRDAEIERDLGSRD